MLFLPGHLKRPIDVNCASMPGLHRNDRGSQAWIRHWPWWVDARCGTLQCTFSFQCPSTCTIAGWEPPHACIGSKSSPHRGNIHYPLNSSQRLYYLEKWNVSNPDPRCQFVIFNETTGNVTSEKCNAWSYDNDGYFTIVGQWDLVCDRNFMAELSQSLYQIGCMVGEILCFVVDIFGRKKILIISHFIIVIVSLVNACPVSYLMFAITRTLLGIFVALNTTSGSTLVLEFFDSRHRTLPGILLQTVWTICSISLTGLAYVTTNWSHLQMTISLASSVFAVMVVLVPESAMWMASKGRKKEANAVLRNIAKWNGIELDPDVILITEDIEGSTGTKERKKFLHVQDTEVMCRAGANEEPSSEDRENECIVRKLVKPAILKLLVLSGAFWFGVCIIFYGIIFLAPSMAGNRFQNFLILTLVELPSPFLAYFLSKMIGRRMTSSISLLTPGCFLAIAAIVPSNSDSMKNLNLAMVTISKGSMTLAFAVMFLYTKEYFPTDIRATCTGIIQLFGRVGALLAPVITYLIKANLEWLPSVIFVMISLVVSILILFLPETKDQPLPESMKDCHNLCKQTSIWRYYKESHKPQRARTEII